MQTVLKQIGTITNRKLYHVNKT